MEWKILSRLDAREIFDTWKGCDHSELKILWEEGRKDALAASGSMVGRADYRQIYEELKDAWKTVAERVDSIPGKNRDSYLTDLFFGTALYRILASHKFTVREASNNQIWYFLTMCVAPEIVYERFCEKDHALKEDRFYSKPQRNYFKCIWWYIYLSMQKNEHGGDDLEKTEKMLENNTTDHIVQVVERVGQDGYRVDLVRAIMELSCTVPGYQGSSTLRRVMKLNTAQTKLIEPGFTLGGVRGYATELFNRVTEHAA